MIYNIKGIWSPIFTDYNGRSNIQVPDYWFAVGIPECGQRQMWPISHDPTVFPRLIYENLKYVF